MKCLVMTRRKLSMIVSDLEPLEGLEVPEVRIHLGTGSIREAMEASARLEVDRGE